MLVAYKWNVETQWYCLHTNISIQQTDYFYTLEINTWIPPLVFYFRSQFDVLMSILSFLISPFSLTRRLGFNFQNNSN